MAADTLADQGAHGLPAGERAAQFGDAPRASCLTTFWPWTSFGGRPSLWLEQRASFELAQLYRNPVYYGAGVPRGDGSPVLLIPGFMGSDNYLSVMRGWLRRTGYRPYTSGIYFNAGPVITLLSGLLRRLDTVSTAEGRPLTIIGHSLGGVFGRVLAVLRPDLVTHVITLGSPLSGDGRQAAHPMVRRMADLLLREGSGPALVLERQLENELFAGALPDGVRLTCIYTHEDAVVRWQSCIDDDPRTAAHPVRGSHSGLAWNADVYSITGRVLLQPLV